MQARVTTQLALNAVLQHLAGLGLEVSCEKKGSAGLSPHSQQGAKHAAPHIGDTPIPWQDSQVPGDYAGQAPHLAAAGAVP